MVDLDRAAFHERLGAAHASLSADGLEGAREVLVYSYGTRGKDLARQLRASGIGCLVYDNAEAARASAATDGFEVTTSLDHDIPLIVAAGQNQIEILDTLERPAFSLAQGLYGLDLRNSYGPARAFTDRTMSQAERLFEVYRRLDEASRPAFFEVLCYRASLEVRHLAHRRPMAEMWRPAARGLDITSFCDVGAYDGDSLTATKAVFPTLARSFTIEPNPDLAPMIAAAAAAAGVENRNFAGAAWSHPTRLDARLIFNGMLVIEEDAKGGDIPAARLDDLLGEAAYDYIKLDVEGSEARVLAGGEQALRKARCIATAAYHLPDDLIDLPRQMDAILGAASGWRLAFAHYSQSFDDSIFYFHRGQPA
jgi:FkbM family methyltransferase